MDHNLDLIIISVTVLSFICFLSFLGSKLVYKVEKVTTITSFYAIFMGTCLLLYILSLITASIFAFLAGAYLYTAAFLLFLAMPFIIGYFANYKKRNFFMNINIVILLFNFLFGLYLSGYLGEKPPLNNQQEVIQAYSIHK